jgi:hypothetical protein
MSPARSLITATGTYDVVNGDRLRSQALVLVPLLDPALPVGFGNRQIIALAADPHVRAHVTNDTLVLTGRPELALPHLATLPVTLIATLLIAGAPRQQVQIVVPMASALPYTASAAALNATMFAVTGRVSQAAYPHAGLAGASVAISGPATGGRLIGLRCPLAWTHGQGVTVRANALTTLTNTTLDAPAAAGDQAVTVASTASITPGRIIGLGPADTIEHVLVDSIDPGTRMVFLSASLVRSRPSGGNVSVAGPGATSSSTTLGRPSSPGDAVLVTSAALVAPVLEIVDPTAGRVEYRARGLIADPGGYWRLDGVRGIGALELTVAATAYLTNGPTTYALDSWRDPNVIDVELTV